jgi:outer membrane cobalamin receptor
MLVIDLHAQSLIKISGFVYSEEGHPLEGVNVVLVGTAYGAATDLRGYFEIQNIFSGEYSLSVNHVGYDEIVKHNIMVAKDAPLRLTFFLIPKIDTLEEISVIARRDSSRDSAYKINLTSEQIHTSSARTLGELLLQIPGVDIIEDGPGSGQKKISIRGSNPNQVLVLLDGIPLNDPLTGEADLNLVPLSIIEDVTIYKGGNAAKSGSGSLGGQVEIKTKQIFGNEISLGLNGGSFQSKGGRVSLSGTLGYFRMFLNYDNQAEKGDFPYTYNELDGKPVSERRLNAGFNSEQVFIKTGYHNAQHQLILQADLFQAIRGLPGVIYFWTPYASANVNRRMIATSYRYYTQKLSVSLQLSAYENTSDYKNTWPETPPLQYRRVPPYHTNYQVRTYQGESTISWAWSKHHEAIVRLLYRKDKFKNEDLLLQDRGPTVEADNTQAAIGVENNWQFLPSTLVDHSLLQLALRLDNVRFDNQLGQRKNTYASPKIGMRIGNDGEWLWNLQINFGRSFRSPTFADLYYQDFRVKGNSTLLPERSVDFDAGFRFGIPWIGQPKVVVSYFQQQIENLIVWELGSFATWQPTNLNARIAGMEYELSWQIWKNHVDIHLNHIQLNAQNRSFQHTTHNKFLIYRPEHTTRLGLNFRLGDLSLSYQKRIISERYVTAANTVSLPGYHVDDLTCRFSFSSGPLNYNLSGMLLNIFDTRYEIVRDAPLPGRHWRAGLEIVY